MLAKTVYNSKRLIKTNGNFLRPKVKTQDKHLPLKMAEVDDQSRIKKGVLERGSVSLRESFDMNLCENPIWKSVDKTKWKSQKGMSYEGQFAPHVST